MLEVLNFHPGEHERKKLKLDSLNSPKSRKMIEDKVIHSDEGSIMEGLGAEIEGVLAHIERLTRGEIALNEPEDKYFIHKQITR